MNGTTGATAPFAFLHKQLDITRLRNGLEVLTLKNVWVDPDCGLKTRTVDEAVAKLKVSVFAAKSVRGEAEE